MEALIDWVSQVNDMVDSYNNLSDEYVTLNRNMRALEKELRASWQGYKEHTEKNYSDFRDEILTIVNNWIATIEPTIQDKIVQSLSTWLEDGTLADIINKDVFDMKVDRGEFETYRSEIHEDLSNMELNQQNFEVEFSKKVDKIVTIAEIENETDITEKIKPYLISGTHLKLPNGTFFIDPVEGLRTPSNFTLEFSPNTVLKALPTDNTNYAILKVYNVQNVKIISPTIVGERYEHTTTGGEWGIGISIRSSDNIEVQNAHISECWGDGIYVGELTDVEGVKSYSQNVTLRDIICDDNRRQGISLISAESFLLENAKLLNTNGTAPQAGIDIEPNAPRNKLTNIRIKNLYTENNVGGGLLLALFTMRDSKNPIDILVDGHKDFKSQHGFSTFGTQGAADGTIILKNLHYELNESSAISVRNYSTGFPHITIENPTIHNANTAGSSSLSYGSAVRIFNDSNDKPTGDTGNVTLKQLRVVDTREPTLVTTALFVRNVPDQNVSMKKVNLIDPLQLDFSESVVQFYGEGMVSDPHGVITKDIAGVDITLYASNYNRTWHNGGSTSRRIVTLPSNTYDNLPPITIELRTSNRVELRPQEDIAIIPLGGTAGTAITSSELGASIQIRKLRGYWVVENMVGNWTVV